MTTNEGAPAPWEIWHARFIFRRPRLQVSPRPSSRLFTERTTGGDDHQRLEQALASTRHSPRGPACSGADESFPRAGGPNCPLATNLPRHCGQDRQAISARCAPSQPGTRGAPPINKSQPRPTNQGRGQCSGQRIRTTESITPTLWSNSYIHWSLVLFGDELRPILPLSFRDLGTIWEPATYSQALPPRNRVDLAHRPCL